MEHCIDKIFTLIPMHYPSISIPSTLMFYTIPLGAQGRCSIDLVQPDKTFSSYKAWNEMIQQADRTFEWTPFLKVLLDWTMNDMACIIYGNPKYYVELSERPAYGQFRLSNSCWTAKISIRLHIDSGKRSLCWQHLITRTPLTAYKFHLPKEIK